MSVLLVGGKGGYINSLVAQVVGISGKIVTVSSNSSILDVCKKRVSQSSPLARIMVWKEMEDVAKPEALWEAFQSAGERFHAVVYCGAVPELPLAAGRLLHDGGSLLAPVQVGENQQQFQLLIHPSAIEREIRKISEFGVIFEKAQ
jgi:protein-L-isoaspartate O-methyltransferase